MNVLPGKYNPWKFFPETWDFDRMKDIVYLRKEKVYVESPEKNYLELEDLESGTGKIISPRDTLNVEGRVTSFENGDVLFGKLMLYLEKYCQADFNGYCTGEILAFLPKRIHGRYFYYCIGSDWLIQLCNALAYGAKMPRVNWPKQLAYFKIPLPPFSEQKNIAEYLDKSCMAIDKVIEIKRKQLETLDVLRKSIIHKTITKGLNPKIVMRETGVGWFGQIPRHWTCESLKRIAKRIQTGGTPPTANPEYYEDGTIDWFAPECFGKTIHLLSPKKMINEAALHDNKLRIFPGGTVYFVGIGATIGKVAMLEKEGSANQQIIGIVCSHKMNSRFLSYQLKIYERIIPQIAQFTTLPIFNQTRVGYLPILRPPIEEQIKICEFLDEKEAELARVEESLNEQIKTILAYRKSLIHECVTGKRRITQAELAEIETYV